MITRLRNRALKRLGISFALLLLTFGFVGLHALGLPQALALVGGIVSTTFAFVFYIQGNIALAEAKGYDGSVVGAIIIVASLCIGGLFFAMPIIIFSLKDKHKVRRHARPTEEFTSRNPPAKLPPLKNDRAT